MEIAFVSDWQTHLLAVLSSNSFLLLASLDVALIIAPLGGDGLVLDISQYTRQNTTL